MKQIINQLLQNHANQIFKFNIKVDFRFLRILQSSLTVILYIIMIRPKYYSTNCKYMPLIFVNP